MALSRQLKDISRALVVAAKEEGVVPAVVSDLLALDEAFQIQPGLLQDMGEKAISLEERQKAVGAAWKKSIHPFVLHAVLLLQRQDLLEDFSAFVQMVLIDAREIAQHYEVTVKTVLPLHKEQRADLEEALQKRLGGTQHIQERIDPSLLGGLIVQIGYWHIDASVKGKLEKFTSI